MAKAGEHRTLTPSRGWNVGADTCPARQGGRPPVHLFRPPRFVQLLLVLVESTPGVPFPVDPSFPLPRPSCLVPLVLKGVGGGVSHAGAPTRKDVLQEGYIKFLSLFFWYIGSF